MRTDASPRGKSVIAGSNQDANRAGPPFAGPPLAGPRVAGWKIALHPRTRDSSLIVMSGRFLANTLVVLLVLWAIYTIVSALIGVNVYFPFHLADEQDIPYHRWQTARLAVFATFIYYGVMHLLYGSKEVFPIHFLKTYLFMLSIVGAIVFIQTQVPLVEYVFVIFFLWIAATLHLATGQRMKRYFRSK